MARNDGLKPGQKLLLTKPLGTGVLATAVKARWDGAEESEAEVTRWCSRLNSVAGGVVRDLKIAAATDITGFGLGGHALEMALASGVTVVLNAEALPLMIHQPSGGFQGQATDIEIHAREVLRLKERLNRMLADNTGRPYKDIVKATERDNFLTPEEAKELGIIDRVLVSRNEMAQEKSE